MSARQARIRLNYCRQSQQCFILLWNNGNSNDNPKTWLSVRGCMFYLPMSFSPLRCSTIQWRNFTTSTRQQGAYVVKLQSWSCRVFENNVETPTYHKLLEMYEFMHFMLHGNGCWKAVSIAFMTDRLTILTVYVDMGNQTVDNVITFRFGCLISLFNGCMSL